MKSEMRRNGRTENLLQVAQEFIEDVEAGRFSCYGGDEERGYLLEERAHRYAARFAKAISEFRVVADPVLEVLLRKNITADGDAMVVPSSDRRESYFVTYDRCSQCTASSYKRLCRHVRTYRALWNAPVTRHADGTLVADLGAVLIHVDGYLRALVVSWEGQVLNEIELPLRMIEHWEQTALSEEYDPFGEEEEAK